MVSRGASGRRRRGTAREIARRRGRATLAFEAELGGRLADRGVSAWRARRRLARRARGVQETATATRTTVVDVRLNSTRRADERRDSGPAPGASTWSVWRRRGVNKRDEDEARGRRGACELVLLVVGQLRARGGATRGMNGIRSRARGDKARSPLVAEVNIACSLSPFRSFESSCSRALRPTLGRRSGGFELVT